MATFQGSTTRQVRPRITTDWIRFAWLSQSIRCPTASLHKEYVEEETLEFTSEIQKILADCSVETGLSIHNRLGLNTNQRNLIRRNNAAKSKYSRSYDPRDRIVAHHLQAEVTLMLRRHKDDLWQKRLTASMMKQTIFGSFSRISIAGGTRTAHTKCKGMGV